MKTCWDGRGGRNQGAIDGDRYCDACLISRGRDITVDFWPTVLDKIGCVYARETPFKSVRIITFACYASYKGCNAHILRHKDIPLASRRPLYEGRILNAQLAN